MHRKSLALMTAALLMGGSVTAARADFGEACCGDLEARIEELEATTARKGNRMVSLQVSGYLNEAAMYWNDGFEDNVYFVTNETERSRIHFKVEAKIAPKWSAGGLLEIGLHSNRENEVDQNDPLSPDSRLPDTRKTNWWLEQEDLGRLTVGRLNMATHHIVHMMLTETWYFARYGIGTWIGANGHGFFLRKTDGTLTDGTNALRWGDIDAHAPGAGAGEGPRADAVKFETANFAGFNAATSYSGVGGADVALRYTGDIGDIKLAAGIGVGQYWLQDLRHCAVVGGNSDAVNCRALGMSGTVMHAPTGLYVYGVYGLERDLNVRALFGAPVDNTTYSYYLQAGVERKFIAAGKTTLFAEFEHDDVGAGVDPSDGSILNTSALGPPGDPNYARMAGSTIDTWGLGIGQAVDDAALELYISGRLFKADVLTSATGLKAGAVSTPIEDFLMIVGGAKIGF